MKKLHKLLNAFPLFLILSIGLISNHSYGQFAPPPPPPPENKGSMGNHSPMGSSGAPIKSGLWVFLTFAAGYAFYSMKLRKE
ncbi:MAG: hypothetical protein HXX13_01885 [Bacteroidetes bacterium]|nr:hypothetical protein [Bacteroidota bacterium]